MKRSFPSRCLSSIEVRKPLTVNSFFFLVTVVSGSSSYARPRTRSRREDSATKSNLHTFPHCRARNPSPSHHRSKIILYTETSLSMGCRTTTAREEGKTEVSGSTERLSDRANVPQAWDPTLCGIQTDVTSSFNEGSSTTSVPRRPRSPALSSVECSSHLARSNFRLRSKMFRFEPEKEAIIVVRRRRQNAVLVFNCVRFVTMAEGKRGFHGDFSFTMEPQCRER